MHLSVRRHFLICHRLIKNKAKKLYAYLILGGRLIGIKNNRKPASGHPKGGAVA